MAGDVLLTIAYSTLADRAHSIRGDVDYPGVEVLVCVQAGPLPGEPPPGTRVIDVPGTGVTKSRNVAIEHARGRYLLFCDDDVQVNLGGVIEGIRHLERTGRALALGQGVDPSGAQRKRYPRSVTPLTRFNSAKAATYEMLIDLDQVRATGIAFDERFGAGTDLHLGDEYIFIADLLRGGLAADAVPLVFGTHPLISSGSRWGSAEDTHARAVALNRVFGRLALGARMAFGWKNRTHLGSWRAVLAFVADGASPPVTEPARSPARRSLRCPTVRLPRVRRRRQPSGS